MKGKATCLSRRCLQSQPHESNFHHPTQKISSQMPHHQPILLSRASTI